ncbi:hypothetical protein EI94DRAFT_1814046 [Lactarius quietus]|nr:hypothetical protein EI94DRAFT_1814046 [Lactarius quietus]
MEDPSGLPPHAGLLAALPQAGPIPSATISVESLSDLLPLMGLQNSTGFQEVNENAVDSSNSMLDSAGFQLLDRNTHHSATSSSGLPTSNLQSAPFGPAINRNTHRNAVSAIAHSDQFNQIKYYALCHASHEDLLAAQNVTYMRIHLEYTKITASHTTLEKAFESLAITVKNKPTMSTLPQPSDLDPAHHSLIMLWTTRDYSIARRDRDEFGKRGPGRATRGENVMFWFLQNEDGLVVDGMVITRMWFLSKQVWSSMLAKRKTLAPTWMNLMPAQQMEFYLDIEDRFPFLRLCEDHYKARKIGTIDYTHWYKACIGKSKAANKEGKKRQRSMTDPDLDNTGTPQGTSNRFKRARRTLSTLS